MKFAIKEGTALTAEMMEALKPFIFDEGGESMIDTERLKTQTDIDNIMRSKRNADTELSGVKKQLTEAQGKLKAYTDQFGDDADPSALFAELDELRKGSSGIQARLIEATQNGKSWQKKFEEQQPLFEQYKQAAEKQAKRELMDRIETIWNHKREKLDPKWNKNKADLLFQDIKHRISIAKDDPEDFESMENGMKFEDYINSRLDLYGAYADVNRGNGNPGNGNPENGNAPMDMFEAAVSGIKFQ